MSVRRLAEESVQPSSFAFSKENAAWAKKRIAMYPEGRQQSAVIPLLMRAQEQDGWISRATIETVADMLEMPYIRVLEVATFYTQFQLQPVGTRAHIQVCGTTPCMLRGAEDIRAVCQKHIHAEPHHLNEDGTMSWEEVECAGACVNAPMVTIGFDTYEDLTPERFEEILLAFRDGKGDTIQPGPQNGRKFSAPLAGQVTLLETPKPRKSAKPAASGTTGEENPDATKPGRKQEVDIEAAPAIKTPAPADAKANAAKSDGKKAKATGNVSPKAAQSASGSGAADKSESPASTNANAPKPLFKAPKGSPDDLKLISGVGPKLEAKLNALGITKFAQVAGFNAEDIAMIDESLNFKGRIDRDNWVDQAKALAEGGIERYREVFGKDPK